MEAWAEKYRPRQIREIVGNPKAIDALQTWLGGWRHGIPSKKAVLLHGPSGTGKTSAARAIAVELGHDFIETNAAETRTQSVINRIVGEATSSRTLDPGMEGKIIIIDEVDGIHGRADYGGMRALSAAMRKTRQPVVLIANDPYKLSRDFRARCLMVDFRRIGQGTIVKVLKEICTQEGVTTDEKALKVIASKAGGDLRAAINDLQAASQGREKVEVQDLETLGVRDTTVGEFDTVKRILKATSCEAARLAMWESSKPPEEVIKWVVENVPVEYEDTEDLAAAMNYVSRADVFLGRIMRRQDWGLYKYASDLMSAGVAMAKKKEYHGWKRFQYPQIFSIMGRTKKERELRNSISKKVGAKCHVSSKVAKRDFLPMLEIAMKSDLDMAARVSSQLDFSQEEIGSIVDDEKLSKKAYLEAERVTRERLKAHLRREELAGSKQVSLFEFKG